MNRIRFGRVAALCVLVAVHGCGEMDVCIPGLQQACACPDGHDGAQACKADGSEFDACEGCGQGGAGPATSSSTGGTRGSGGGEGGAGGSVATCPAATCTDLTPDGGMLLNCSAPCGSSDSDCVHVCASAVQLPSGKAIFNVPAVHTPISACAMACPGDVYWAMQVKIPPAHCFTVLGPALPNGFVVTRVPTGAGPPSFCKNPVSPCGEFLPAPMNQDTYVLLTIREPANATRFTIDVETDGNCWTGPCQASCSGD